MSFLAHCLDLLSPLGPVRARAMMGGHVLDARGLPVALVWEDGLFLKTGEEDRPAFAAAGCTPFTYELRGRMVEMSYWSAPEGAIEDAESLAPWAARALAAAERAAAAKRPRKRPAAKRPREAAATATARGTSGSRRRSRGRSRS